MLAPRSTQLAILTLAALLSVLPLGVVSALAGFALLAYLPGSLLIRFLGIENHWSRGGRIVLSVAVSLATVPWFLNPVWHLTHDRFVVLAAVWCALVALLMLRKDAPSLIKPDGVFFEHKSTKILAGVIAAVVVIATLLPYWPTELYGYPVACQIHDHIKHHAILYSLEHRALPLGNVFYADGAETPVYYYHFFYLIPATVRLWTNHAMDLELAYGLGSALVALSTAGLAYAFVKRFTGGESPAALTATLFTVVGSFDLFPLIIHVIKIAKPVLVQDAWAIHQYRLHNILNQMMWAPQNVIGILVVLVGVYVLSARGRWRGWFVFGPIWGASLVGSSIWVAIGALPALAIWALTKPRLLFGAVCVGMLMAAVAAPTLMGYLEADSRHGGSLSAQWDVNAYATLGRLVGPGILANWLDLPVRLVIEFGAKIVFLPLVPLVLWRKMWRDDGLRWLFIAAIISVVGITIFHSNMKYNAYGQRIIMLAMVFTAIMAGCAVANSPGQATWWNPLGWELAKPNLSRRWRVFIVGSLLIGCPMGFYEAPLMAVRRYFKEWWWPGQRSAELQAEVEDEQAAHLFMRYELPADAVVQGDVWEDRALLAQIARRQLGVIEPQDDVMVFDPPDRQAYLDCVEEIRTTLRDGASAAETYEVLRRHGITHVFLGVIENRDWANVDRFDDTRYFNTVFRSHAIRIVALTDGDPSARNSQP
jgi:hypothetical protein